MGCPKFDFHTGEGLRSFSEAKIEEQKWTPGAGAYDTQTPLSQVGGALGREKRGGAFAGESDGPGPGVDACVKNQLWGAPRHRRDVVLPSSLVDLRSG